MTAFWIVMCPVNRSTFRVPLIFPEKFYLVVNLERVNPRCQVNIVGDEECLTRSQLNDESLMRAAVIVVREQPSDPSFSLYLNMALVLCKRTSQTLVTATLVTFANSRRCIDPGGRRRYARGSGSKNGGKTDDQAKKT